MLELRRVLKANDPAIAGFGLLQNRTYFEPDMLIPAQYIGQMLKQSQRNVLLVLENAERVVAGTLFHYLAKTNVGFSSYMAVDQEFRGQGLARRLHQARFVVLEEIAGGKVTGLFIDVVNPFRLSSVEIDLEHSVGSDPTSRLQVFSRLGFKRVNVLYEQPVGGKNGGAVTNMDLLFCPRETTDSVPTSLVVETMRTYWTGWLRANIVSRAASDLESRAAGERIALLPLEI